MISIIITAFKEPKTIGKCIEAIINQDIKEDYELILSAPDKETQDIAKTYQKQNKNLSRPWKRKKLCTQPSSSKIKRRHNHPHRWRCLCFRKFNKQYYQ
jgi:glycosyltransferase involved in cell wall biosynthesis